MRTKINALIRLTRCREFSFFVVVTTLLGAASANGVFGWRMVYVLVANWLAVCFAFMINDVEDAPEDSLNPAKATRNPVSAAHLSVKAGYTASFFVALLALLVFSLLGLWPFINGVICIALGFFYSWRRVRLKILPVLDMLSHCMMLAGLQFLAAYFTFEPSNWLRWLFPFIFIVSVSLYGELFNEMRDLEGDLKAGLMHTAILLGQRATYWLMMSVMSIAVVSAAITIFWVRLIPAWVLLMLVVLAVILVIPPAIRIKRNKSAIELQESFQKPLEISAAIALLSQYVWAWALPLMLRYSGYLTQTILSWKIF